MITMNELVDLRMHQHLAHELYRQQIMQRIPDPFPTMLPVPIPRHIMLPPRVTLPGVEANLQNNDLWKQFHQIGTEMIITKSGRRMFPSMRLSLSGLEDDVNYCVLLEMVPIGDCRYKFSGSQWVPAGGAEPQSPQRIYLHADSPASGSHWQAQPILFNKVKLTNNTLDNNGHIVLTSMHKYQPRIHVIRTSDPTQIPWAPQQAFIFPETEFVAVTAYQNDRITKLKIDNNPFAKGFRETGQSRCKRKMNGSPQGSNEQLDQSSKVPQNESDGNYQGNNIGNPGSNFNKMNGKHSENISDDNDDVHYTQAVKRMRSNSSAGSISSLDEGGGYVRSCSSNSSDVSSPGTPVNLEAGMPGNHSRLSPPPSSLSKRNEFLMHHIHQNMHSLINPSIVDLACTYLGRSAPTSSSPSSMRQHQQYNFHHHHPSHVFSQHSSVNRLNSSNFIYNASQMGESSAMFNGSSPVPGDIAPVVSPHSPSIEVKTNSNNNLMKMPRKSSFTISAILGADH